MSKLVILLVYPEHEIDELVEQHEAMFKSNVMT